MSHFLMIFVCLSFICGSAQAKKVEIITFEAPPFVSENLPEQGAAVFALREIFKKANYDLKVRFAPFLRAKVLAQKEPALAGYFPVTSINVANGFKMSKSIFQTPWVFAERKSNPVVWKNPEDILPYRIGNASGYDISPPFRALHAKQKLKIEPAPSDELNLLKLANKRVDLVFIDAGMFTYLVKTSAKLKPFRHNLQINPKIIQLDQYGIAFKKTPNTLKCMEAFNNVATEEEFNQLITTYFKRYAVPFSDAPNKDAQN